MEIIFYVIPFIVAIFLLIFYRRETTYWEYFLLIVPSVLLFIISRAIIVSSSQSDVEYLGDYITKVRHYDEWDEWIVRRCSRQVPSGRDSKGNTIYRTEYYDCSYRDYHPERWSYFDQEGDEHWLYYEEEYDKIRRKFGTREIFIDMHRDYYRIDGDAQEYRWNGTEKTAWTVTHSHNYKNKIQSSRSIFGFTKIDKKEADTLGLYNYPEIADDYDQLPVLGGESLPKEQIDAIRYTNAFYGKKYQFRNYVLLFKNKDIEISELQRSYWVGGNKNELVTCIGVDDNMKVQWCNAFSWCDAPTLDIKTESYFAERDSIDLVDYSSMIRECLVNGEWERKSFEDFDYIKTEISSVAELVLLIITIIYNIGISTFIVLNKEKNHI